MCKTDTCIPTLNISELFEYNFISALVEPVPKFKFKCLSIVDKELRIINLFLHLNIVHTMHQLYKNLYRKLLFYYYLQYYTVFFMF